MDQFVLYVDDSVADPAIKVAGDAAVQTVFYRKDLVESLVDQPNLLGAGILLPQIDDEWETLLRSISHSFSRHPLLIMTPDGGAERVADLDSVRFTSVDLSDPPGITSAITNLLAEPGKRDRREYHRFDFPLRGRLFAADEPVHDIRQISAGGAFLRPNGITPESGTECEIEIMFQNFSINTACRILDPRDASSALGAGFGIRFTSLSPAAASFIDRTVQDALVAVLTDPESDPAVPTLDEDADLLSIGDEFTLEI